MGFPSPQPGRGGSGAVCSGRAGGRGTNKISSISPIVVCVPVAERREPKYSACPLELIPEGWLLLRYGEKRAQGVAGVLAKVVGMYCVVFSS